VGGEVSRITLRLPVDIPFGDFMSRVCARMGLDPRNARLGYKYIGRDPRRNPWHALTNEEDLRAAMDRGVGYIRRARKCRMILEIENLACIIPLSLLIRRLIYVLATSSSYSPGSEGSQTRSQ
jgi:hypothetical protein